MNTYSRIRQLANSGAGYDEVEDRMAEEAERRNDEARDRELEEQTKDST